MNVDSGYQRSLDESRTEIDRLDREIIALLLQRLQATATIGRLRKEHGLRGIGPHDRGSQVLARYQHANLVLDDLGSVSLEPIGRAILEQSATVQHQIVS